MKTEILKRLKASAGFVSGQELCESLQVSRTAIWKVVRQLESDGYQIEAVRNRGYRLVGSGDVLTAAEVESCLKGTVFGGSLVYREVVDSTNNLAKSLAEAGAAHGTVVIAQSQDAGKGRRGKGWNSPPGTGVFMSLILRPDILPRKVSALTLVAALAVQKALDETVDVKPLIKWPNDVVINGKKVCGILTEMSSETDSVHYLVIGIGINANQLSFPEAISKTATSLRIETGKTFRRALLISEVMYQLEAYYETFLKTSDMELLSDDYKKVMVNSDRQVTILEPSGQWNGVAVGINRQGELLVRTEQGGITSVCSGEVSVRGIYGYV